MRVVFISAECEPWAKTGGLGDVVDALARALPRAEAGSIGEGGGAAASRAPAAETRAPAEDAAARPISAAPGAHSIPGQLVGAGSGEVVQASTDAVLASATHDQPIASPVGSSLPGVADRGIAGDGAPALPEPAAPADSSHVDYPVDVFLPRYRGMSVPPEATTRELTVGDPGTPGGLTKVHIVEFEARGYRVRLVDLPAAFDRDGYYGDAKGDYADNPWRFGMLCRAALATLRADGQPVDVLHLHDWQSMPTVLYRDVAYAADPVVGRAAVVVTIHNLAYQGWVSRAQLHGLAFPEEIELLVEPAADGLLLLREGVRRAEMVNTVSPGYAREVLTPAFGMDMEKVLASRGDHFTGILNGLDMAVWDPATDSVLPATYSATDRSGKATCRRALLGELGFDPDSDGPLLGMIGRLDPQKGFDLLTGAAPQLVADGARIVALGTGDPKLLADLKSLAREHPRSVAVVEAFDRALARRIYAGADLFVMPSRFEPCGQGQMISSRYATPPVVTRTGGLADTVVDADARANAGTGFVSDEATVAGVLDACRRAIRHFREGGAAWEALLDRGMAIDWSWEAGPAAEYAELYRRAMAARVEREAALADVSGGTARPYSPTATNREPKPLG